MNDSIITPAAKAGTAGGTLLVLLINIFDATDILHTILLSAMGAIVSFGVSLLLKMLVRYIKQIKGRKR